MRGSLQVGEPLLGGRAKFKMLDYRRRYRRAELEQELKLLIYAQPVRPHARPDRIYFTYLTRPCARPYRHVPPL